MQLNYRTVLRVCTLRALLAAGAVAAAASSGYLSPASALADAPANDAARQVPLPYTFHDNFGTQWDVQQDGSIGPGNANIYTSGGKLFVGQNEQYNPNIAAAQFDAARNDLVLAQQPLAGLNVTRHVTVDSKQGYCRWVEVLENGSGAAIKTQVHLNVELAAAIQSTQNIVDDKSHRTIGLASFDGSRGIGMLGAGRGSAIVPTFAPQQGNDQVDVTWDVEVPAHKTVAIVHLQAVRTNVNDAQSAFEKITDRQALHDIPPALSRVVVNFASHPSAFGDMELLRGDLLDVVELRDGDQYRGTIQEKTFALQSAYGLINLPAEKVLAMIAVGDFRPTQLIVTRDGEAFGGVLQSPMLHFQLSSGQVTPVPIGSIKRFGYRKQLNEPEEFKYDHPMLLLRNGDRIAVDMPDSAIAVSTRYGNLLLKPQSIGALVFQGDDQAVHELLLTDGSHIAALVAGDALELRPISIGASKPVSFPAASVSRLQFVQKIEEPGEQAPVLSLTTGDRLAGALGGKLMLDTAFDTISIDGAEIRGLHHAGSAPTEVQITLWDETTLSGRLKGDVIDMTLKSGPALHVPSALVEEYVQPQPQPPASVVEKLRGLVADLASDDWKRADRASSELGTMGPKITGALRTIRGQQAKVVQDRIDLVLARFEPKSETPATGPAPGN